MKQLVCTFSNAGIINNPVNLKAVTPLAPPPFDQVQFASVASLHVDRKGQDIALEVLSSVKWKERAWQFNIYGSGPHKKYLEELVRYYGLEQKVCFKGHVADINALWKENHVLLLTSRIETGPMALTEAMLCGRPVVSTRVGKVPEIVQHGYNGYIAEAATVRLFDEALEEAWQDRDNWSLKGKRAYESAMAAIDLQAPSTFLNILLHTKQ
jgi:glycosyltransferase involved in cell wall biosynthesis